MPLQLPKIGSRPEQTRGHLGEENHVSGLSAKKRCDWKHFQPIYKVQFTVTAADLSDFFKQICYAINFI
jgi:hypothetical protein